MRCHSDDWSPAHLGRRHGQILIRDIAEHLQVAAISITDAGWVALARLAPIQSRVNDTQFAGITAEEFDELHRLVQLLVKNSDLAIQLQRHVIAMESGGADS